jgi:hypothetical protein
MEVLLYKKKLGFFLERHALFFAFSDYLLEVTQQAKTITFEDWMKSRPELNSFIEKLRQKPEKK